MALDRCLLVAALSVTVSGTGCTLIGFGIGSAADAGHTPQGTALRPAELERLSRGSGVQVQMRDGSVIGGRYLGLELTGGPDYPARYQRAVAEIGPEPVLPALGRGASVRLPKGKAIDATLLGFGPGYVSVRTADGAVKTLPLDRLESVTDAAGRTVTVATLRELQESRRLPSIARLNIDVGSGKRQMAAYDEVVEVTVVKKDHSNRKTGLLLGMVADVAVIAASAYAFSQPWESSGSTTYTSCPLVDSFDGHEFVLDAEPLGGSIYHAAERTDLVRLDHAAAVDGEYRLRLRNDQQELDHVDTLALRVVDHAPGTEVVPASDGRLYVVRGAVPPAGGHVLPTSRIDRSDVPLATVLASADGETWASDFRGRDPGVPEQLRDGIELEFPRPADTGRAVLLVRAGATALAPRVLQATLALHGRDLSRFYERLEVDSRARAAYEAAREREVLPTVRLLERSGWRTVGHVRDLPSLVLRDQAVPFELGATEGSTVRLRIDGPPGFWLLDRAVLATADDAEAIAQRVPLSSAVMMDEGRDVTTVLARPDHWRHLLRPRRDGVNLRFTAPAARPGWQRTVLLEATGYYSVIVPAVGDPQREVIQRLVEQPGAVARFALEWLRDRSRLEAPAVVAQR